MKTTMTTGFPLVIGVVIAAASVTQENYGGAVFAIVAGGGISLWIRLASRKK